MAESTKLPKEKTNLTPTNTLKLQHNLMKLSTPIYSRTSLPVFTRTSLLLSIPEPLYSYLYQNPLLLSQPEPLYSCLYDFYFANWKRKVLEQVTVISIIIPLH